MATLMVPAAVTGIVTVTTTGLMNVLTGVVTDMAPDMDTRFVTEAGIITEAMTANQEGRPQAALFRGV